MRSSPVSLVSAGDTSKGTHKSNPVKLALCAQLLVAALTVQCGLAEGIEKLSNVGRDVTTDTIAVLDEAVDSLESESGQWREILEKALTDLPKEASSLIRNEISNVLSRTIAAAGVQAMCFADFLGARVRQQLMRIRATLLQALLPPLEPALCTPNPTTIDMELAPAARNKIEFFGYDLDRTPLKVLHVTTSGSSDVSSKLDRPSPYLMTLNLAGNGVPLTSASQRLVVQWEGHDISTIAVLQRTTPVCTTDQASAEPRTVTLVPPLTQGDREFKGNGPDVRINVALSIRLTQVGSRQTSELVATYSMYARETKGDRTTASGSEQSVVWTAPQGRVIDAILGPTTEVVSYRDDTVTSDSFKKALADYVVIGDTEGDDVGQSKVTIAFHPVQVALREVGECVSARAAMLTFGQTDAISQLTRDRLTSQLQALPTTLRDNLIRSPRP
jgi:hypothetical protein